MRTRRSHVSITCLSPHQSLSKKAFPKLLKLSDLARSSWNLSPLGFVNIAPSNNDETSTYSSFHEMKCQSSLKYFETPLELKPLDPIHLSNGLLGSGETNRYNICQESKAKKLSKKQTEPSKILMPCGLIGYSIHLGATNYSNQEMSGLERRRSSVCLLPLGPPHQPAFFNIAMDVKNCQKYFSTGFAEWIDKHQGNIDPIQIAQRLTRCCKRHLAIVAPVLVERTSVQGNHNDQANWFNDLSHLLVYSHRHPSASESLEAFLSRIEQAPRFARMVEVCAQIEELIDNMIMSEEPASMIGTGYRDGVVLTCLSAIISTPKQHFPSFLNKTSSAMQSLALNGENKIQMQPEENAGLTTLITVKETSGKHVNLTQETNSKWGQGAVTFEHSIYYQTETTQDPIFMQSKDYDMETVQQTYGKLESFNMLQQSSPSFETPLPQHTLVYEPELLYLEEARGNWLTPPLIDGGDNGSQSNARGNDGASHISSLLLPTTDITSLEDDDDDNEEEEEEEEGEKKRKEGRRGRSAAEHLSIKEQATARRISSENLFPFSTKKEK